jgi:hypothetical protein
MAGKTPEVDRMPKLISKMHESLTFTPPERPKPESFSFVHVLTPMEMDRLLHDPEFPRYLKSCIAAELAKFIFKKSQAFQLPPMDDLMRGLPIRIQVDINDRGSYENWIPREREEAESQGRKEGRKRAIESLPFGTNHNEFWE